VLKLQTETNGEQHFGQVSPVRIKSRKNCLSEIVFFWYQNKGSLGKLGHWCFSGSLCSLQKVLPQ